MTSASAGGAAVPSTTAALKSKNSMQPSGVAWCSKWSTQSRRCLARSPTASRKRRRFRWSTRQPRISACAARDFASSNAQRSRAKSSASASSASTMPPRTSFLKVCGSRFSLLTSSSAVCLKTTATASRSARSSSRLDPESTACTDVSTRLWTRARYSGQRRAKSATCAPTSPRPCGSSGTMPKSSPKRRRRLFFDASFSTDRQRARRWDTASVLRPYLRTVAFVASSTWTLCARFRGAVQSTSRLRLW
mmetsp:Transcript_3198/g.11002  ORF Transcript_3198/g.11002 Transcript_3198/m.11002 type:complete len:249 (-) Transcript_3198:689-1435(-)